jgi:hypothetical protein
MITFTGLCDLNSIVIPRLGFPFSKIFFSKFSFQISKINNLKVLGLDHAFLVEFPFSFKNNKNSSLYLFYKIKVGSKYLYLTWCAFEHQVRKSSLTL